MFQPVCANKSDRNTTLKLYSFAILKHKTKKNCYAYNETLYLWDN